MVDADQLNRVNYRNDHATMTAPQTNNQYRCCCCGGGGGRRCRRCFELQ